MHHVLIREAPGPPSPPVAKMFSAPRHQISAKSAPQKTPKRDKVKFAKNSANLERTVLV